MIFRKEDFPFFKAHPSLIYFDNAATTQKPRAVIKAMSNFYAHNNATAYRGFYELAERATETLEKIRSYCAHFIGAAPKDIAFTHSATEAFNLVAHAWGRTVIEPGDEIILSELDHHANILPWIALAKERGAFIKWLRINFDGSIDRASLNDLITSKTKLIAITGYSNVLGNLDLITNTTGFIKQLIDKAHRSGVKVLVDACQLVPHQAMDVKQLECDFLVFSGHKMLGPTGVGVVYVRPELQSQMSPYQMGGGMVTTLNHSDIEWKAFPHILEAGTHSLANIVGFGAALDYLDADGRTMQALWEYESNLLKHFIKKLREIPEITVLNGEHPEITGSLASFIVEGIHSHDIAAYLDTHGICVRAGNHCAQLLHKRMGINSSVRVSLYGYNTVEEIDRAIEKIKVAVYSLSSHRLQ